MKGKTTKRHDRRRKLATVLILGAIGGVTAEPAFAQDLQHISDERVEFDIAPQALSSALSEFARQARVNALFFSDDLRMCRSCHKIKTLRDIKNIWKVKRLSGEMLSQYERRRRYGAQLHSRPFQSRRDRPGASPWKR